MKKLVLGVLAILTVASLAACKNQEKPEVTPQNSTTIEETESNVAKGMTNEEMYSDVVNEYQNASAEFNLDDVNIDETITTKYPMVSNTLLAHVARYASEGAKITYDYKDIDKNGTNELIVGVNGAAGAVYTYDASSKEAVKVFFQDTLERGDLSIYDNGVILSSGAGGAALHYYEFGRIATDGITYESLEAVEEEYVEGKETPVYKNAKTGEELSYTSIDEVMNKYIANAKKSI